MLMDRQLVFSRQQAVTASARSTDVHDAKDVRDLGAGRELYLLIVVDEDVTAAGAATVTFTLETDDAAAFPSPAVLFTTPAIGKATLVKGYEVAKVALPVGAAYERFLSVNYTVGTGPLTAGKFTAAIVDGVRAYKAYPNAYDA